MTALAARLERIEQKLDLLLSGKPAAQERRIAGLRFSGAKRPKWWYDDEVRELVLNLHGRMILDKAIADITAKVGPARAPKRTSMGRVWALLSKKRRAA